MPKTADVVTILDALEADLELYARTGLKVSTGRLAMWMRDVRAAVEQAKEKK